MRQEQNYDFRARVCREHVRIPGWRERTPQADELALAEPVSISCACPGEVARTALDDLRAFLKTAFGLTARTAEAGGTIELSLDPSVKGYAARRITVDGRGVRVAASDERGLAQAVYDLEWRMKLRRAPYLARGVTERRPAFSPRMIHSGLGIDLYPDEYLACCARHGFDAVLVFLRDAGHAGLRDRTYDFNDLVRRAARYGIDVYAYSFSRCYVHPEEPGAREAFDRAYGDVFRAVPGLKGMVFVGESVQFPSRDPKADPLPHDAPPPDGIPTGKPHAGWWPCLDYAQWIALARDSIRAARPDADVILWSYNWGKAPKPDRLALVDRLPADISLLVTFEMFDRLPLGGSVAEVSDYTVAHVGPGEYFKSEAEAAARRGIRLYAMTNTAGRTWDFGTAPFEPFPGQWHARNAAALDAREKYGLSGLMESHHYGFLPSVISYLAREAFTLGGEPFEAALDAWAAAAAGEESETLLTGLRLLDASVRRMVPSYENQYGAYRVGPAYPFCLNRATKWPSPPGAMFGNGIYQVLDVRSDTPRRDPYSVRLGDELRRSREALQRNTEGLRALKSIRHKTAQVKRLVDLAEFLARCHRTAIHTKQFEQCRRRLLTASDRQEVRRQSERIEAIVRRERKNVLATIPLVRRNSELGYEPSMEYQCDEAALRWKLRQLDYLTKTELAPYRGAEF